MIELIAAEREIATIQTTPDDDHLFTQHAQQRVRIRFHEMNTDLHWFALFLHPLARKLAISSASHSRTIEKAYDVVFDLCRRWNWSEEVVMKVIQDLRRYHAGEAPFSEGSADARAWWSQLSVNMKECPLKALAIRIFSIVPHAAEIERLFSDLGGVQSPKRCRLSVAHMETLGILRNHYTNELSGGKTTHRHHAHMHTREGGGANVEKLTELTQQWAFEPDTSVTTQTPTPDEISLQEIDEAFRELQNIPPGQATGDGQGAAVGVEEVYNVAEMDRIRKGLAPKAVGDDVAAHDGGAGEGKWSKESILRKLGIQQTQ